MIPSANSVLGHRDYLSVNPDFNITVSRLPITGWVGSLAVVRSPRAVSAKPMRNSMTNTA